MKATDQLKRAALMKTMDYLLEDPEYNVTTIMDMLDKVAPARTALTCRNRKAPSICAASDAPSPTSGRRWPSACGTTPPTRAPLPRRHHREHGRHRQREVHRPRPHVREDDGIERTRHTPAMPSPSTPTARATQNQRRHAPRQQPRKRNPFIFSAISQHPKIGFRFVEFSVKCKWHFSSQANMPEKPNPLYQAQVAGSCAWPHKALCQQAVRQAAAQNFR